MIKRTCGMPECTKPHRARGLCSTHYNQQHASTEQRHAKQTVPCTWCQADCIKDVGRENKYDELFCSLACRDANRARHATERRLPVGPVPHTWCRIPAGHPARRQPKRPRVWTAGYCAECTTTYLSIQPGTRFCSLACTKRWHRRKQKEDQGQVVPATVRAYVYERDGWTCWLCDLPILRDARSPHPLSHSVDHVLPQSLGGGHEATNLRAAHFLCNAKRGNRPAPAPRRSSSGGAAAR